MHNKHNHDRPQETGSAITSLSPRQASSTQQREENEENDEDDLDAFLETIDDDEQLVFNDEELNDIDDEFDSEDPKILVTEEIEEESDEENDENDSTQIASFSKFGYFFQIRIFLPNFAIICINKHIPAAFIRRGPHQTSRDSICNVGFGRDRLSGKPPPSPMGVSEKLPSSLKYMKQMV